MDNAKAEKIRITDFPGHGALRSSGAIPRAYRIMLVLDSSNLLTVLACTVTISDILALRRPISCHKSQISAGVYLAKTFPGDLLDTGDKSEIIFAVAW